MSLKLSTRQSGQKSEAIAAEFLQRNGLTLVTENFRGPQGEIDLIMRDKDYLVFIEVRMRNDQDFGLSVETINKSKQSRIIQTALYYLVQENLLDKTFCRFDVIGMGKDQQIEWIQNAFEVSY
jgi:putative endonuclease